MEWLHLILTVPEIFDRLNFADILKLRLIFNKKSIVHPIPIQDKEGELWTLEEINSSNVRIIGHIIKYGAVETFIDAIKKDRPLAVQLLNRISFNIDYNFQWERVSGTAVMHCARHNRSKMLKDLIKLGANVNKTRNGQTAVLLTNSTRILKILLKAGADINVIDHSGLTILMKAVRNNNYSLVRLLLKLEVDPNISGHREETALSLAKNLRMTKILLSVGADINARVGDPVLVRAVQEHEWSMIKLLLKRGANPNILNQNDKRVLQIALESVNPISFKIMKLLIKHGADTRDVQKIKHLVPTGHYNGNNFSQLEIEKYTIEKNNAFWDAKWQYLQDVPNF